MFRDKIGKNKILVKYIMVSYPAPTAILPHFNPKVFDTEDIALTLADANKLYFKKSGGIVTGPVSMPSLILNGVSVTNKLNEIDTNSAKLIDVSYNNNTTSILNDLSVNGILKLPNLPNVGNDISSNKQKTTKISYDAGTSVTTIADTLKSSGTLIVGNQNYNVSDEFYKLLGVSRGVTPVLTITDAVTMLGTLNLPNHSNIDTILTNFETILLNMSYTAGITDLLTISSNVQIPQNLQLGTITDVEQKIIDINNTTTNLETKVTGISYNSVQDLTTIDNSLNITSNLELGTITDVEQKILDINNTTTNLETKVTGISYNSVQDLTTIDNSLNITSNLQLGSIVNVEDAINNAGGVPSITYDAVTETTSIDGNFVIIPQLTIRPEVDLQDAVQEIYSKNGTATLKLGDNDGTTTTFSNIIKSENGKATFYGNNSGETKFMEYDPIYDRIYINKDMELASNILYIDNLFIQEQIGKAPTGQRGSITLSHDDVGGTSSIVFKSSRDSAVDHGYISYTDDYDGSTTLDRSLLEIGVQNDSDVDPTRIDNIAIMPSGFVGINTRTPEYMLDLSGDMKISGDMRISGDIQTYNTIIQERPYLNSDGNGVSVKPLTNPSLNGGSIFDVRSIGNGCRLFCGQSVTSSVKNQFCFGYNSTDGQEGLSTNYTGKLGTDGSVECSEVKVNSIPLNSFTNIFLGSEYLPKNNSNSTIKYGDGLRLKYDSVNNTNSVSYSHLEEFILNSTSGDYFTCKNSNFFGTYEITATVIFRNYSGSQRYNPVIGIAIDDDTNDVTDPTLPNWGKKAHGLTPFSVQYVRMNEGKSCDLKATRIHHFTDTTEEISINTYLKSGSGDEFNNFSTQYQIGSACISFKYLGNFNSITT
jgi:hypothetical protein